MNINNFAKNKILFIVVVSFLVFNSFSAQSFTKIFDPISSDDNYSEGTTWGDINNDGYLDAFVPHLYTDRNNIIFVNNGNGSFTRIETGEVVEDPGQSSGGIFADFDNDDDLDLFVTNYFELDNFLYLNNGDGTFKKVLNGIIVTDGGFSFGSSTADFDNDGFLDIYVTNGPFTENGAQNYLYRNNGNGLFIKVTQGAIVTSVGHSNSSTWCDYDNDGYIDLFVSNGGAFETFDVRNFLYKNNGDGTFTEISSSVSGIEDSFASSGNWGDFDNDGDFDLFVTNYSGNDNIIYVNNGNGTFSKVDVGDMSHDGGDTVSSALGDYDNDGDLDIYVTNDFNENNNFYINNGDWTFTKIISGDFVNDGGRSNGATWADYDNDGDLDLFVPNGQRPQRQNNILYRNEGNANHWINIKCEGLTSNRSAIGTKIKAKAIINNTPTWQLRQIAGGTGFNAQNSLNVEFGFGGTTIIDSLIIEWPSGLNETYVNVEVDKFYKAVEGIGLNPVLTGIKEVEEIPIEFKLSQNYPNPFNPETIIKYEIPFATIVVLDIYNSLGEKVKNVLSEFKNAGSYEVSVNLNGLPTGIYFYTLTTDQKTFSNKMAFVK